MSEIVVVEYKENCRHLWEKFVRSSNNGTIFHLQTFLDYHPTGKYNFHHLMFFENNRLVAVLPGGITEKGIFWSPVGASYGSLVTENLPFEKCLRIVDAMMDYFDKNNFKEIFLIPPPIIYNKIITQNIEYAMLYRKFDFELHYISHAIHLNFDTPENFISFFDKTARKTIRKILRNEEISVKRSNDYYTFNQILVKNKAKHNAKPTHSLEDMLRLSSLLPDDVLLNMVYYKETPIAGSLLFVCNPKVVLCFYNMLLYEYEHFRPIYLIMYETVRWAIENGFEWVDIGVSQDTKSPNPMTPALSLISFKERFNSYGILRSTFHYKFRE
ncbi:MAG: GNAT family N-acetyltransferase [Ignavibacteria bacterium]|nr:GNAT family N-acetyltransferase [Ignavibacteria bacterium]